MCPRTREEVAQMLIEWSEDLGTFEGSALVIVEGKRDMRALSELGIGTDATPLNLGLSMAELVESISHGKGPFEGRRYDLAVILTDWDRKGGRLARSLEDACQSTGLRYDLEFRRRITLIAGRWVKDVESLPSLLRNLEDGSSLDVREHPHGVPPSP